MTSLLGNSRSILARISCIHRSAGTTSTTNGGKDVQPSGASTNLSEASRSADGTDMALRAAKQRATSEDPIRPKPAGETPGNPRVGKSLNIYGTFGFGIILGLSAYFIYTNYIKNPEFAKSLKHSKEASKRDAHEQLIDLDASAGKKH